MTLKLVGKGTRLRCSWEVVAGVLPGQAMPEYTKRWDLTSETFYEEAELSEEEFQKRFPDGKSSFVQCREEAEQYLASLQHPAYINWAKLEWLYY